MQKQKSRPKARARANANSANARAARRETETEDIGTQYKVLMDNGKEVSQEKHDEVCLCTPSRRPLHREATRERHHFGLTDFFDDDEEEEEEEEEEETEDGT